MIHTLAGEFDIYKEVNGESIPVNCDDVSNGFLKPKPGKLPPSGPHLTLVKWLLRSTIMKHRLRVLS